MIGSDNAALLPLFLSKIRSVRMLDTIVCSGALVWAVWQFSPACDTVQLTLEVGFICPFVVIDPNDSASLSGRMLDNFLLIPNAESLPLYRMVSKLACVHHWTSPRLRSWIYLRDQSFFSRFMNRYVTSRDETYNKKSSLGSAGDFCSDASRTVIITLLILHHL